MSLLDTHVGFLAALRRAGLAVSLAEGLDALHALGRAGWGERETVRATYAATLVKRQPQRVTFDALFDLYWPRMVGNGVVAGADQVVGLDEAAAGTLGELDEATLAALLAERGDVATPGELRDNPEALARARDELVDALLAGEAYALAEAAVEGVARFGMLRGRGAGMSSWSAFSTLQRIHPEQLISRVVAALVAGGMDRERAGVVATRRVEEYVRHVEAEARRRVSEEKGPDHMARATVRPTIDRLDFLSARRSDLEEMRREIYPLARRLAVRLAKEQHAVRRGPLDVRRTVRASISTGGVPVVTHHRPRRPRRTDLVVLCDVSGSVAHFASFTLMLVYALRESFGAVRAFTFVDDVTEVTEHFRAGGDVREAMAGLSESIAHAARVGRTNYGRVFDRFLAEHGDALGPKSSLLVLGDARSNHADLRLDALAELAGGVRHAWWLNPEHARQWGSGDSAALEYGRVVPMSECRNLTQLAQFVHDLA